MLTQSSRGFGLHIDRTQNMAIEDYSTPDDWKDIGFEMQFTFIVDFQLLREQFERVELMEQLLATLDHCLELGDGHGILHSPTSKQLWSYLTVAFGVTQTMNKIEPPYGEKSVFLLSVFWDKGRLDLRKLSRLANEVHAVAQLNQASVELVGMLIIPRSKTTLTSKLAVIKPNR